MNQNQSNDQQKEVLTIDALFEKQKAKVNLIAEIFDNKDFFLKDIRIQKAISKKLNDKGFIWLRNRIDELKLVRKMVSA